MHRSRGLCIPCRYSVFLPLSLQELTSLFAVYVARAAPQDLPAGVYFAQSKNGWVVKHKSSNGTWMNKAFRLHTAGEKEWGDETR